MSRRILVVDDEPAIRRLLTAYLQADGYAVEDAATGDEALCHATANRPDLVLLDIGLPDIDGLEVLRRLRADQPALCVILVTARAEELDKLVGLSVGADDYITKPFSPREVVARVGTVLRRAAPTADPSAAQDVVMQFPELQIDPARREVRRKGRAVELSALDFDILIALASHPGRVFSRAQLLEQVWGYDFYGDERVVDVHVRSIRRQLNDDAASPSILGTVRGVGYKFLPTPIPTGRLRQ